MKRRIHEIQSMNEIFSFLEEGTHVFFDLDHTLMMTDHHFGSIPWETFMINHFMSHGDSEKQAIDRSSSLWKAIQTVSNVKFVEKNTLEIFNKLKSLGYPVFGLTAREASIISLTEKQLQGLGIEFCRPEHEYSLKSPMGYSNGVFYSCDTCKSEVLKMYAEKTNCSKLLHVDDKFSFFENAANLLGEKFTGLHYTFLNDHVTRYTPDETTYLISKILVNPSALSFFLDALPSKSG